MPMSVGKVNWFRKCLSILPGFCSYCGRMYVSCHSKSISLFLPVPQNGKCCPSGHEGYVDQFVGCGEVRWKFDYIKCPPQTEGWSYLNKLTENGRSCIEIGFFIIRISRKSAGYYSYLNASITANFAALLAGRIPNTIPVIEVITNANPTTSGVIIQ